VDRVSQEIRTLASLRKVRLQKTCIDDRVHDSLAHSAQRFDVPRDEMSPTGRPTLYTVDEVAALLRTSRKAVYLMTERRQLPGVVRIGRRLLFRTGALLDWLRQKESAPSLEEQR
jgi:excisionase family DNA binding protein